VTDHVESYDIVDPWLYEVLTADTFIASKVGTKVSSGLDGSGIKAPYATWDSVSVRSIRGIGGVLLDTDGLYTIKAVTVGSSYGDAAALAARFRTLLDEKNVTRTVPIPASISCYWENEVRYPEVAEGVQYRHFGGTYRIRAVAL
jgi:hypothetical protein